ncbi:hypothetical protein AVEN_183230-1 [Araneus ventricosus]|uniref:Uncharacterized protein n=1 Tax=Araneus ventricosus TaxID=182803 RepID=A0A4Y2S1J4_ARAVE|nr:hypothetical protein AVEN_183230-1 [Araneus ventricosus]
MKKTFARLIGGLCNCAYEIFSEGGLENIFTSRNTHDEEQQKENIEKGSPSARMNSSMYAILRDSKHLFRTPLHLPTPQMTISETKMLGTQVTHRHSSSPRMPIRKTLRNE